MERIKKEFVQRIVSHINNKDWWHVPPLDPLAYSKRGEFFLFRVSATLSFGVGRLMNLNTCQSQTLYLGAVSQL